MPALLLEVDTAGAILRCLFVADRDREEAVLQEVYDRLGIEAKKSPDAATPGQETKTDDLG